MHSERKSTPGEISAQENSYSSMSYRIQKVSGVLIQGFKCMGSSVPMVKGVLVEGFKFLLRVKGILKLSLLRVQGCPC